MNISTPYLVLKVYNEPLRDGNDLKFEICHLKWLSSFAVI